MFKHNALRTAIVHDWLTTLGGAEKVLASFIRLFPDADLYSLIDFFPEDRRSFLSGKRAKTSFLQKVPFIKSKYRLSIPIMPLVIEQFDLSEYDLIISSSHAVAKNIMTHGEQTHICYCHSPMRYAWDLYHSYLKINGLERGLKGIIAKLILHYLRIWDMTGSSRVDHFIANSHHVAQRIKKHYSREADVIYPPVDTQYFQPNGQREDYYITASRMVPYKRVDLVVEAFNRMPDKRLVVIGDGPDFNKIKSIAGKNVDMKGFQPDHVLRDHLQRARAFIFAAQDDFGIMPVEAQACGVPVLAYQRGGALETVVENTTGLFFGEQTANSLIATVHEFERANGKFDSVAIRKNAERFSTMRFEEEILSFLEEKLGNKPKASTIYGSNG